MANNSPILKTLAYSDVFDYPLEKEEIWKFLVGKIDRKEFEKGLDSLQHKSRFYFFSGRKEIVKKRIERKKESEKKLELATKIIQKLSLVPTVLFIGISGGLALENADEKDDIDLFVITSEGNLWITRLILVFLLKLMGQYRGCGKKESQKVCLNMLIDEQALELKHHDLYTAHEIVQLKPMFDRDNVYNKFLSANEWVLRFLPNARIKNPHFAKASRGRHESRIKENKKPLFIIHYSLFILDKFAKTIQLNHMRKYRTTETVSDKMLAFHPFEYREYVLKEYNKRLKQYEI
ncbi:MAG: hypothetical protein Q7R51_02450 [bacterium]|nr:hypothetical protein [bacterium]